jgi:hypothetical protein
VYQFRPLKLLFAAIILMSLTALTSAQEAENGGGEYTGTWSLVIGPSRLVWQLDAESYEFYAYQAGAIRIGSRGEISAEEGQITFIAREVTEDGETWREVELPEEEASTTFAYAVEEVLATGGAVAGIGGSGEDGPGENGPDTGPGGNGPDTGPGENGPGDDAAANGEPERETVLRLSIPGRPQFFTDYVAGSGEPVEEMTENGEDDAAGNGGAME